MGRAVKCPSCNESFVRSETEHVEKNKRYYHKECAEESFKEAEEYKKLIEYICYIRDVKRPSRIIVKQIQRLKEQLNIDNKTIFITLKYFHEIQGNPVRKDKSVGIGIVEYVYEEALEYYKKLLSNKKTNENFTSYEKELKIVKLNKKKPVKLFDLEKEIPLDD